MGRESRGAAGHGAYPRVRPCGDTALTIEFGETIDPDLNAKVLALDAELTAHPVAGVLETVPTYRSLLVHIDPVIADPEALAADLLAMAANLPPTGEAVRRWRIPVVYGGAFGVDLADVAARHGLSPSALIDAHCAPVYRVYMIGFMPGFTYLGGLDPRLATPRRSDPRPLIPASSVIIGGAQAAISSIAGPSGWHLLGRTPVRPYHPGRDPAFLIASGDEIVFEPIAEDHWRVLDKAAAAGEPVADMVAS
ncbi:5-oxoprolinase subunit PxpB [Chelatococcus asaccharovorans]|uniref:KipI family sensor histidine kinase inhibitor n=1 Tax=Chelatococcus asaccharovorans TaxID=28210 RepID=A0A2V3UE36_9HYPH|nr:5-oxoprolinase subunit PxpB [Chelatococcus asaccharovorans]MBS7707120.1 5-oxoprolinase subunit PxpB [Chelatococcus asaccharovorans]PXW63300.1 KipI family sensor histidine kinase inhibitor [Chelatococcus asaccharovorans]